MTSLPLALLLAARPAGQPVVRAAEPEAVAPSRELTLSLPLACEPRKTCFLQNYVDGDPGPDARDYRCGAATYDGHKGVDFRVLSTAVADRPDGVAVRAAAPGIVKGGRDGMTDALIRIAGRSAVKGRECGNGVLIDHGGGWETQYCHMRRGSIVVQRGQRVERGQKLGLVGYSGMADFAHLHLSVRKEGKVIDPFTGQQPGAACSRDGAVRGLWDADATRAFPYPETDVLGAGFAGVVPGVLALEQKHELAPPEPDSPVLLYFARLANIRQGDRILMRLIGPGGVTVESPGKPHPKSQAVTLPYVGKKRSGANWPRGAYKGTLSIERDGREIARATATFDMR